MFFKDKFSRAQSQKKKHSSTDDTASQTGSELSLKQALDRWSLLASADENDLESRLKLLEINEALGNQDEIKQLISELSGPRFVNIRDAELAVARHYFNAHENDRALEHWLKYHEKYADQYESCNSLAHLYSRIGEFDEANKYADLLAEKHDLVVKAHEIRAAIYQSQELWTKAVESLTSAIKEEPSDELDRKLILALIKDNQLDKATERVEAGLAEHSDCTKRLALKQLVLQRQEDWPSAINVVDRLIELQGPSNKLLISKADLLYKHTLLDESEALCEQVLQGDPKNIQALTLYARISQIRLNRTQAAA